VGGNDKMKISIALFVILLLICINNCLIFIFPITINDLTGKYRSVFENIEYTLEINQNGNSTIKAKDVLTNKILDVTNCKKLSFEDANYRVTSTKTLSFSKCDTMDFNTLLDRDMFGIKIGNNGIEANRIDPDSNVYFRKK
jgi:hypothetical protein